MMGWLLAAMVANAFAQDGAMSAVISHSQPLSAKDIEIPYQNPPETNEILRAQDNDMLDAFVDNATTIVLGRVVDIPHSRFQRQPFATIIIEESLRGEAQGSIELEYPLEHGLDPPPTSLVEGYTLLIFLDEHGHLLDGDGLFFIEGGFAWRNRRESVFLRPTLDRVWVEDIDPTHDYICFQLSRIRSLLKTTRSIWPWSK